MAVKIQIKRGTKAGLPTLSPGEYGLATDTGELFIGGANGNIQVATLGSDGKIPGGNLDLSGYVPTTRKINNKALSADVTLSAGDVNAVPTTRTVNGKALSSDITLTAGDVGAYTKEESAEAAENAIEPVGTIKATVRTDLGDKWLLCNGDEVLASEYPELAAQLSESIVTSAFAEKNFYSGDYSANVINCITYANGYWVVGGTYREGTVRNAFISYATSLTGAWTTKVLWSTDGSQSSSSLYSTINCITYANGYWVVGGLYYHDSIYYATIGYTTSLTGAWTTKELYNSGSTDGSLKCITYDNGYWVVGGNYYNGYDYAIIAYATEPSGTWSNTQWSARSSTINCITYANGYWVAGGKTSNYASIFYATDPTGTWSTKNLSDTDSGGAQTIKCITYADNYWVVGRLYRLNGEYCAVVSYATSLTGTWTTKVLSSGSTTHEVTCICYADGYWVAGKYYLDSSSSRYIAELAISTSLEGEWIERKLWDSNKACTINCIDYSDGNLVVGGQSYDSNYNAVIGYNSENGVLPTITGDFYAYIKAKE